MRHEDKGTIIFETSISIYQSTRQDSPEDLNLHHLRVNIQSRSTVVVRSHTKEMTNMTTCHKRRVCCAPGHLFKVQTRYVPRSFNFSFILVPRTVQISGAVKMVQGDTKKRELLKNPPKIEEI